MNVEIDDFYVGGEPRYLEVLVPTPAAFIFNKGLVFRRRNNHLKKAKDLYYIFDILANLEGTERQREVKEGDRQIILEKPYLVKYAGK